MPVCQTDCVSGMCGHLRFYTMLSDQSGGWCWRVTGQGAACGALLGHVWTIQHGCHQNIPGVCCCWLMASHWSRQSRKHAGCGLWNEASCMLPGVWVMWQHKIINWTQKSSVTSTTSRKHKGRNQTIVHKGKNNNKGSRKDQSSVWTGFSHYLSSCLKL